MAQLAIRGHATRGKEVIEILEMLGGTNTTPLLKGDEVSQIYYIRESNNEIICSTYTTYKDSCKVFSLEEFLEKYPYKVGDKVITKHPDDHKGFLIFEIGSMKWNRDSNRVLYKMEADDVLVFSAEELQPYKEQEIMEEKETMEEKENSVVINHEHKQLKVHSLGYDKVQLMIDDKYELKQEGDAYYIVRRQPQYPKTYAECCDILQLEHTFDLNDLTIEEESLIKSFIRLKRCRDAYRKLYGEQMRFGKPWKPDWCNENKLKYCIEFSWGVVDVKARSFVRNSFLAFPTEEIRDAFYENFKELIEECKELL